MIGKDQLDALYARFNHRECVHPDPIEFLYDYEDPLDREIVGMVAASLAYGKVAHIMRSVADALGRMGARKHPHPDGPPSGCLALDTPASSASADSKEKKGGTPERPRQGITLRTGATRGRGKQVRGDETGASARPADWLREASNETLQAAFAGFRHRFATGRELALLLLGLQRLIPRHRSLGACFASHLKPADTTVGPALNPFVRELRDACDGLESHLLPDPSRGSACKRLNLFLRWMVRHDEIDPGGWDAVPPARLIVPLDTHMHRLCGALGLTKRAAADLRAALEITEGFRVFAPDDPVRYDFAISHLGIRGEEDILLAQAGAQPKPR